MSALGCLRERTHSIQFFTLAVVDESAPVSAAVSAGARSESLLVASRFGFIPISAAARSFRPPVGVISLVSRFSIPAFEEYSSFVPPAALGMRDEYTTWNPF